MAASRLTMLNSMADQDFRTALSRHREWGLQWLDLRDGIYGHWVAALDLETARRARADIDESGLDVFCMSTSIFYDDIDKGEAAFRAEKHLGKLDHIIALAQIFRPKVVRLIAAQLGSRTFEENAVETIERKHPWVFDIYREAIDRVCAAGLNPTIENECKKCFIAKPEEFLLFFDRLDRAGEVALTWDVQNGWSCGVFPAVDVYDRIKPLIQYYHVKGGQAEPGTRRLAWNVALEEADWPVVELTRRVVADGVSPVICINPPQHGENKPGYDYASVAKRDVDFLRANVPGLQ